MLDFGTRFFICNLFITGIAGAILILKQVLNKHLPGRIQYNLWFPVLALLTVPFLPVRLIGPVQCFSRIRSSASGPLLDVTDPGQATAVPHPEAALDWINDFSVSVTRQTSATVNTVLLCIWLAGITGMICFMLRSRLRLYRLEASALPLQDLKVHEVFITCKDQLDIRQNIAVYSSAYIKSPFTVGILKPRIYLPIHLILDHTETECRFILLHELQHCKQKDAIINVLMNLAHIIYWFNPIIWYSLKEMRSDREIACDAAVLDLLREKEYESYGNCLINFAEKISLSAFPFVSGIGGNKEQIKRRIIHIASYQKKTLSEKCKGICIYCLITVCILSFAPLLSVQANPERTWSPQLSGQQSSDPTISERQIFDPEISDRQISDMDLSDYFQGYDGSFVLYDSANDHWMVYNVAKAKRRVSPDSTYKIYSALFALEQGLVSPKDTFKTWDGQTYPIREWNTDQDLSSAFRYSVNWYFQDLDTDAGLNALKDFYTDIDYGNHDLSGGITDFWMESSLKISPLEQVALLKKFYNNEFNFDKQNVQTVKDALLVSNSQKGSLHGKTGTGAVNGQNINGWFIGYVDTADTTWFFAANIAPQNHLSIRTQSTEQAFSDNDTEAANASGAAASEITLQILRDRNIFS